MWCKKSKLLFAMIELVLYGSVIGFLIAGFSSFLFHAMEFGNIFWKVRYYAALYYAKRHKGEFPLEKFLKDIILQAKEADYEDQADIASQAYAKVASKELMFTRFICPMCMTGTISIAILGAMSIFLLYNGANYGEVLLVATSAFVCGFVFSKLINLIP